MNREVIALPRRDRVVLALLVSEDVGPGGLGRLTVVAEDGARFVIPGDQVLARFRDVLGPDAPAGPAAALAHLRGQLERPVAWKELHARLAPGASLAFDDVAGALGATDERSRLAAALALGSAEPWLRRNGTTWSVTPREQAVARVAAAEASRRAEREDAEFLAWWPRRAAETPPAGVAGAVAAVREFALRGEERRTDRGRALAARVELHEPDQVLEALLAAGLVEPDVNPAPFRAGLADPFPDDALEEARERAASPPDPSGREDLTALHAVAVDDEETTEVDDAISIRRTDGAVELLVHISDAAVFVPAGGALDAVARERASSLYVPDGSVTMLPRPLVERGSLEAGELREAVTGAFRLGPDGTVFSARFFRSLIRVSRRLAYDATKDVAVLAATPEDARALVEAAQALRDARIRGGAVVAGLPSLKIRRSGTEAVIETRRQDTPGDLVVAEAAVLFNSEAGRLFAARDVTALFRTQDVARTPPPAATDPLWPVLVRRRFAPTHLRTEPSRHHGIGRDAYVQATSPLRRYADLLNQRQLVAVVEGHAPPYRPADLERLSGHVSDRERAVRRASTAREDYWVARWVQQRGLREVEGVLSRAPRRGLGSVWVEELLAELPLRAEGRWKAPPEGTRATWRIERVLPWRGRIELSPSDAG